MLYVICVPNLLICKPFYKFSVLWELSVVNILSIFFLWRGEGEGPYKQINKQTKKMYLSILPVKQ